MTGEALSGGEITPLPDIDPEVVSLMADLEEMLRASPDEYGVAVTGLRSQALSNMTERGVAGSRLDVLKSLLATTMDKVVAYQASKGLTDKVELSALIEAANSILLDLVHALSPDEVELPQLDDLSSAVVGRLDEGLDFERDKQPPLPDDWTTSTSEPVGKFDWIRKANCRGCDPGIFYPGPGESQREAAEICRGCVVRKDCLEYAITNNEIFGIWGSTSERARRRMINQRRKSI